MTFDKTLKHCIQAKIHYGLWGDLGNLAALAVDSITDGNPVDFMELRRSNSAASSGMLQQASVL